MSTPPPDLSGVAAAAPASPTLERLLTDFVLELVSHRSSPATVKAYQLINRRFLEFLAERGIATADALATSHLTEFIAAVTRPPHRRQLAANSVAVYEHGLRAFTAWITRRRHCLFDPAGRLPRRPQPPQSLPCVPTVAQVEALFAACPIATPLGIRTRTLLELLYGSGLRIGEALAFAIGDCDLATGRLAIRSGKGARARLVPATDTARLWLGRYLSDARPLFTRKDRPTDAVFLGATTGRPLGMGTARESFHAARRAAGLATLPLVPHSLRHAAATHLLAAGCDIAYIQQLLGHAELTTTEHYTAVVIDDLIEAHRRFHPAAARRRLDHSSFRP